MNEVILSGLGILLALCGMTVLIFRRVSPIIVGPLAALLVTVMSGLPVLDSVTGVYVAGVGSFFVSSLGTSWAACTRSAGRRRRSAKRWCGGSAPKTAWWRA